MSERRLHVLTCLFLRNEAPSPPRWLGSISRRGDQSRTDARSKTPPKKEPPQQERGATRALHPLSFLRRPMHCKRCPLVQR